VLLALLHLLLVSPTHAAGEAELNRLSAEMARLAQKSAWAGVERKYAELLLLKRVEIPGSLHMLAAHAARERGDAVAAYERATRAKEADPNDLEMVEEASRWRNEFLILYGKVAIDLSVAFKGEPRIEALDGAGFDPTVRTALARADDALRADRSFVGYLPIGRYRLGDTRFDIVGAELEKVFVKPARPTARTTEPTPLPDERPPDRLLTLAVRGSGWQADSWPTVAGAVRDALYTVDGVLTVDAFQPDAHWVVVRPSPEALVELDVSLADLAGTVKRSLDVRRVVATDTAFAFPPGTTEAAAVAPVIVGFRATDDGDPVPVTLASVATIQQPATGPFPMPSDSGPVAAHRFEVKVRGGSDAVEHLLPAIARVDGADALRITLEAQEVP
jgi:hypothetical protein